MWAPPRKRWRLEVAKSLKRFHLWLRTIHGIERARTGALGVRTRGAGHAVPRASVRHSPVAPPAREPGPPELASPLRTSGSGL